MKTSYLFLAEGFEEIEALAVVDVMRRAGMDVKTVSIDDILKVKGAHGVVVEADMAIADANLSEAEWLILPGGMPGAVNLSNCGILNKALREQYAKGAKIAAICASPAVVLAPLGILDGNEATCYPGFEERCPKAVMHNNHVVIAENVITANGPAAALKFGLAIVATSMGEGVAKEVGRGMLLYAKDVEFYF